MPGSLEGKVALVTGGSSGIGRATCLAFAREGAKVVVADINVEGGKETVGMVEKGGGTGLFTRADVTKSSEVEALIRGVVEAYGRLDCAFNNAGIGGEWGTTVECTEENWANVIAVNLKGVWLCMKHELPQMEKQGGGAIVNTSSILGLTGTAGSSAYNASKHGVMGLTKTTALEFAKSGIRVNAVCPGYIRTPMTEFFRQDPTSDAQITSLHPVGRIGEPEEVAEAVVWLCSDAASFVTGVGMAVDGGYMAQ